MGWKAKLLKSRNRRSRPEKLDKKVCSREEFVKRRVFRQEKWVFTADDWYPNYNVFGQADDEGDMVRVSLIHMGRFNQKTKEIVFTSWRVCIWGADDTGVEMDVKTRQEGQMWFDRVVNFVSREELLAWGFVWA